LLKFFILQLLFFDGFDNFCFKQLLGLGLGSFCLIHLDTLFSHIYFIFSFLFLDTKNLANCSVFKKKLKNSFIKKNECSQKTLQMHVQIKISLWNVSYKKIRNIIHWTIETFMRYIESYFCRHTKQSLFTLFLLIQTRAPTSWEFLTSLQYLVSRILNLVTQRYCHFSKFYEWILENKKKFRCFVSE
jgi:hypothetical protein